MDAPVALRVGKVEKRVRDGRGDVDRLRFMVKYISWTLRRRDLVPIGLYPRPIPVQTAGYQCCISFLGR